MIEDVDEVEESPDGEILDDFPDSMPLSEEYKDEFDLDEEED